MFYKFLILFFFFSVTVKAQEDILIKELLEGIVDDLPEDIDLSELSERLLFLKKHPININKTNPQELKSLFFLSALQIANFFSYQSLNGKLIDVLELQAIPGFDELTVQKLLHFVHLNDTDLKEKISIRNLIKIGENDIVIRYASTLEKQKGFNDLQGSRYLGGPEKLLLRYKYNFSDRITMSLVTEKDAGEKLATFPLDFLTVNFTINDIGIIKKLSVGDYSLQFGQGLTLWSGFGFGKGPDVTSISKKDDGLKAYASANEYSFFKGIGTKIELLKNIELTSFWSLRNLDASVSNNSVLTLNETGYHRTQNEVNNSNTIKQSVYGSALNYHGSNFNMGFVAYQAHFNKAFITGDDAYRLFNFTGKNLTKFGFHYNYCFKNTYFFGEITNGWALINGIIISLSNKISAVVSHRHYAKNYHNFFTQASSESGGFNESGFYIGLNISPSKKWMLSIYADYFKFPWLKFRVDAPSQGYEILTQINYTPSKILKVKMRYKSELKQQNTDLDVPINYLEDVNKKSIRIDLDWKLGKTISLQNKLEISAYQKGALKTEFGYLIYQDFALTPLQAKFSTNLRVAYFSTSSYNNRIYAYEDDMLYNFSFGIYNGKGIRSYLNIKYKLFKQTDIWIRYARFHYQNVLTVGSGLDEIKGKEKTELKIQLRYQF